MRVLVTGGEGFIGTHLMDKLSDTAYSYDLKSDKDILDREKLESVMGVCDVVVHLAALTSVPLSIENPIKYYRTNVTGTASVVLAAEKVGVKKIIYAGSSSSYQPESSPYARSKYLGEEIVKQFSGDKVVLRFFNVFGPGQNPDYAGVIPRFFEGIHDGEIEIFGDGKQTRDFTHVEDVVMGIKAAIDKDVETDDVVDLGYGDPTSINDLAEYILGSVGKPVSIKRSSQREEVRHSKADPTVANMWLDWMPKKPFYDRLEEFIHEAY